MGAFWGGVVGFFLGYLLQLALHGLGITPSYPYGTVWPVVVVSLIGVGVGAAVGWVGVLGGRR